MFKKKSPVRELLGEAEVGEADVSLAVQQDVLGLEVAVDDFFGVEVLDGADDLGGVEEARAVAEASPAAQVAEELATRHVVHQHVEEALVVVRPESGRREVKVREQLFRHKTQVSNSGPRKAKCNILCSICTADTTKP